MLTCLGASESSIFDPGLLQMSGSFDILARPAPGMVQPDPSRIYDGAQIAYEHVALAADTIAFRLRTLESGQPVLEDLLLTPGDGGLVSLDSTASQLSGLSARLRLEADRLSMRGQRAADRLSYRLTATGLRPITGTVLVDDSWSPLTIDGDQLDLDLDCSLDGQSIGNPVVRGVAVSRSSSPATVSLDAPDQAFSAHGQQLGLALDPDWGVVAIHGNGDCTIRRALPGSSDTAGLLATMAELDLQLPHAERPLADGLASGAIRLAANGIEVRCSSLRWQLRQAADGGIELAHCQATDPDDTVRFVIDGSDHPVRLRGTARAITVDHGQDGRYTLRIDGMGAVNGSMAHAGSWDPFTSQGETLSLGFEPGDDGSLAVRHMRLQGGDDPAEVSITGGPWPGRLRGSWMAMQLGIDGAVERFETSDDASFSGLGAQP